MPDLTGWVNLSDRVRWIKKGTIAQGVLKEIKPYTWEGKQAYNFLLTTDSGDVWVNGHFRFNQLIIDNCKVGDKVRIEFLGNKNNKPIFDVKYISLVPGERKI
jgi:hypothetical protein